MRNCDWLLHCQLTLYINIWYFKIWVLALKLLKGTEGFSFAIFSQLCWDKTDKQEPPAIVFLKTSSMSNLDAGWNALDLSTKSINSNAINILDHNGKTFMLLFQRYYACLFSGILISQIKGGYKKSYMGIQAPGYLCSWISPRTHQEE